MRDMEIEKVLRSRYLCAMCINKANLERDLSVHCILLVIALLVSYLLFIFASRVYLGVSESSAFSLEGSPYHPDHGMIPHFTMG